MPLRLLRLIHCCLLSIFTVGLQMEGALVAQTPTAEKSWLSSPLEFEPNRGQAPPNTLYLARSQNLLFLVHSNALDMSLQGKNGENQKLSFVFEGTHSPAEVQVSEPTGGESNYLVGSDPKSWHTHVPHYKRITYKEIYPGIDLVFYGTGPRLEHDFIVSPGVDPGRIRVRIEGPGVHPTLTAAGDLSVISGQQAVTIQNPEIYQHEGTQKKILQGRFTLLGNNEIGFSVAEYDHSRPLVIDPVLAVSTYVADLSLNVSALATDAAGNTYVTGLTGSSSYPVTAGSFQPSCASCAASLPDVFITKFNPAGTAQVFSTFLGGDNYDQPFGIAVDHSGNVLVAGYTQSTNFPTKLSIPHGPPGYAMTFGFLSSLTPDGANLNYSSLLGGTNTQGSSGTSITALTLDQNGNAYISGLTDSELYPVTALNCCTPGYPNSIVFVTKFLSTGQIGYSSLVGNPQPQNGGGGPTGVSALQVDGIGNAYVSGEAGTLWPITSTAYQKQIQGSLPYAAPFVSKLDPTGSTLIYSTYLGNGSVNGMAIDSAGNAWLTGTPNGPNFPTTANAYQSTPPSSICCVPFISKLNATGSRLLYSSFFYGTGYFSATPSSIALDALGNVWLEGSTQDPQWPLVKPIQGLPGNSASGISTTGFVSRFGPAGKLLTFSSYLGSPSGGTQLAGLAIDGSGNVHVAGFTSDDLYTTPGAYLPSVTPPPPFNDYTYGFVAVINPSRSGGTVCANSDSEGIQFAYAPVAATTPHQVTLTNCGTAPLNIHSFQSSAPEFTIPSATNGCTKTIAINASCTLVVDFAPTSTIFYSASLTLTSNASIAVSVLGMQGTGAVPQIQFFQSSIVFDPQFLLQTSPAQFLLIGNSGFAPLILDLIKTQITGDFAYTQSGCDQPIQQGTYCLFTLAFTPTAAGIRTGQFSIVSNDPATPLLPIALSGTGYSSYPKPSISNVNSPTIPISSTAVGIAVQGNNFFPGSIAKINGFSQQTVYTNSGLLQVSVSPTLLSSMRQLNLVIVNPQPGGGASRGFTLTVYRSIPLQASDLAYDAIGQRLFAAIPASASNNPNSVIPINPSTGALLAPIAVGNDPQRLAVSDDGSYLYVVLNGDKAIQRINLKTRKIERTFPLPIDPSFGQTTALYVSVVPGFPQLLVAALFRSASPAEDGIALFNDQGLVNWLPNSPPAYTTVDSFAFAGNPPVVYAMPFDTSFLQSYSVGTSGIQAIATGSSGPYPNNLVASDGQLLYAANGTVWDPATGTQVATYTPSLFFAAGVIPATAKQRTYFLDEFGTDGVTVESYSQVTGTLTGSVAFPNLYPPDVFSFHRWGTDGFAFQMGNFVPTQDSNQLILFKSTF